MADIYQLTEFQYDNLKKVANGNTPLVILVEAIPSDDDKTRERLNKQIEDIRDLVTLGMFKDMTGSFAEKIASQKLEAGRGFLVFLITDIGYDMFHKIRNKYIN